MKKERVKKATEAKKEKVDKKATATKIHKEATKKPVEAAARGRKKTIKSVEHTKASPQSKQVQKIAKEPKVKIKEKIEKVPIIDVEKVVPEKDIRALRPVEVEKFDREIELPKEKRIFAKPTGKPLLAIAPPPKPKPKPVVVAPPPPKPIERKIEVTPPITVKDLSSLTGIKANLILRNLMDNNILVNINTYINEDAIALVALEFNKEIEIKKASTTETEILKEEPDKPEDLKPRAPVVVFMGHVDHGKTSLLDRIRQTKVAAGEAGGITQHIGAYKVSINSKEVIFLDTPGHEAFTQMRARGAKITDVAVLVVAADDGVMPQTEEAINHARAAGVPIVVAVNKVDKKDANSNRVKHQLSQLGLIPEDWGGNTVFVEVSALKGTNIDRLVEMLSLEADLLELKANPKKPARGSVIEAKKDESRGVVATLLVQNGTLRRGDVIVCGRAHGKVRAMHNESGRSLHEAPPSTPVEIMGISEVPDAGDQFVVMKDIDAARKIAESRGERARAQQLAERTHVSLENLYSHIEAGKIKEARVIIKADVKGSIEVLRQSIQNISHAEVKIRVMHSGVGNINESDVMLADVSDTIILGFNVSIEERAESLAKEKGVDIRTYNVIYNAIEDVKAALEGLLEPELVEQVQGHVLVKEVFKVSKVGNIAGCLVTDGKIERISQVRLIREGKVLHTGKLESLKRFKDDVKDVSNGFECGIRLAGFNDVRRGDTIEAFTIQKIARKLNK